MEPFRFEEISISGTNAGSCDSSLTCIDPLRFCDFSYGGSGDCMSCTIVNSLGGCTGTAFSNFPSDAIQDCQNRCESGMHIY